MERGGTTRRLAAAARWVDWGAVTWMGPLRGALVCAAAFVVTMPRPEVAIPVSIGTILVGLVDPTGTFGLRIRAMGLTAVLITLGTALGMAVSEAVPAHLVVAALLAFAYGAIGAVGPRAGIAGMVGLVAFAVFSGTPEPIGETLPTAGWVAVGGGLQVAVVVAWALLRRMGEVRTEVFAVYRGLAHSLRGDARGIPAVTAAQRIETARERVAVSGAEGATRAWLDELLDAAYGLRCACFGLAAEDALHGDAQARTVDGVMHAVARAAFRIGSALHVPLLRRRIAPAHADAVRVIAAARAELPAAWRPALDAIERDLDRAAKLVEGPWPIGRRAERGPVLRPPTGAGDGLRGLIAGDRPSLIHATRLAIAFTIGTLIAETVFPLDHAYWLPMTVAWLMRPGLSDSATRLVQRVGGTIVGVCLTALVLGLIWNPPFAVVMILLSAAVVFAFALPNYMIATEGVTAYVLTLFLLDGHGLLDTGPARILATAAAALVIWVMLRLWRPPVDDRALLDLAGQARALRDYADAVRAQRDRALPQRTAMVRAHVASGAAITTAAREPTAHRVDPDWAEAVHRDLLRASATPIAAELTGDPDLLAAITDTSLAELDVLADRLDALRAGAAPAPPGPSAASPAPFGARIAQAHARVDALTA